MLGMAIASGYIMLNFATTATLRCRKVRDTTTQCTYSIRYLSQSRPHIAKTFGNVQGAKTTTVQEEYEDSDGDRRVRTIHKFFLITASGEVELFDEHSLDLSEESSVNHFISGTEKNELILRRNSISILFFWVVLILIFAGSFTLLRGCLVVVIQETLILEKFQIIHRLKRAFGTTEFTYPLSSASVHIKHWQDSDSDDWYAPTIALTSGTEVKLVNTMDGEEARRTAEDVASFLGLPAPKMPNSKATGQMPALPTRDQTERERRIDSYPVVYHGVIASYAGKLIDTLPDSCANLLVGVDRELRNLGFQLFGELVCSKYASISVFCYVSPRREAYAVVYDDTLHSPKYEFFSKFSDGATYTSTNSKLLICSFPWLKIFRFSYPKTSPLYLWQKHQEHLSNAKGRISYLEPTLEAIARSLDEYLVNENRVPLRILIYLINGIYGLD